MSKNNYMDGTKLSFEEIMTGKISKNMIKSQKAINKLSKMDEKHKVSTKDLARALKRVGKTAKKSKTSFNNLIKSIKNNE